MSSSSSFFSGSNPTPTEYQTAVNLVAQATQQATAALASQNAAATSAQTAQGYSVSAGTSATTATNQASSASTSAAGAATSATNASTSATNAASSASSASTSATNASNSASAAATSATNASNSASAAATSASNAASTLASALTKSDNLASLTNAATARTNLGVAIGSNVQAWDADLDAIGAISGTSGLLKKTAANTWSLDTTSYLSGTVAIGNGGTGATDATNARTNLGLTGLATTTPGTGVTTALGVNVGSAGAFVTNGGALGTPSSGNLANCTFPTLNQNTTGTASNVTGTVAILNGGSGQTTAQAAMNAFAGATTSGQFLRGNGTNVVMSAIQVADVPTLNQNTTGTASNITGTLAVAQGGTGATTTTGSGSNVLATSPTLVTPVLGTPTSVTLTNATGLPVSTGITGLGTGVATFLATPTSANLAAAVTDETGTGALVFASSPTIATPTLSTSFTSPLHIGGTTASSTLTLQSTSGVGTSDSIVFKVGNNGATTAATFDTNGNLGIGATPGSFGKLAIIGTSGTTQAFIGVGSDGWAFNTFTSNAAYLTYASTTVTQIGFGSQQAIPLSFFTGNTERARISADGTFRVKGGGTAGSTDAVQFSGSAPASAMTLDASGRLGVGTTSPYSKLSVVNTSPSSGINQILTLGNDYNASGLNEPTIRFDNNFSGSYAGWTIGAQVAGGSYFRICQFTGSTPTLNEALRIDSSGNLLVGTANSTASGKIRATYTPTSQWGFDASESTVTIANGGNAILPVGSGLLMITGQNATGTTGVYAVGGGAVAFIAASAGVFVAPTTTPGAGTISVAWDGTNYRIYNNQGNQITFGVCSLRTRANN